MKGPRLRDRLRARWRLRDHAPLGTRSREGDLVFVSGTVHPLDETLVAPLSGKQCVAYRARAKGAASPPHKGNTLWRVTMQVRPFAIERDDDGARISVTGDHVHFVLAPEKLGRHFERESSFLARHAIARSKGNASFNEVLVAVGAKVLVGGTLVLVPPDAPPIGELGFRDPPPPDPQLVGNRHVPLVIVARGT